MQLTEAFVSELVGLPVELWTGTSQTRIGKIEDIVVSSAEAFPPVVGFQIRATDGKHKYASMDYVIAVTLKQLILERQPIDFSAAALPADEVLLNKELLDKQILDVDGKKVVRVNDIKLAPAGDQLRVIAADIGLSGLLRRLGMRGPAQKWLTRTDRPGFRQALIAWDAVQPLHRDAPSDFIRLRVSNEKLDRIHPADLAAIIEDLTTSDQASLMSSLDEETAAEAFEQLDVDTQLSILEDLKPDRAADIIENMSPDDAADLLAEIEPERQRELLSLMEPDEADDVRELLSHDEQTAGGLMTTEYLTVAPTFKVGEIFQHVRAKAQDAEIVYFIYVTDEDEHLLGVLSLRQVILAEPDQIVRDVMVTDPVTVEPTTRREDVASILARYDFVAVPVVDGDGKLRGIVTVDDIIDVLLPEKLRKLVPRVGKKGRAAHAAQG